MTRFYVTRPARAAVRPRRQARRRLRDEARVSCHSGMPRSLSTLPLIFQRYAPKRSRSLFVRTEKIFLSISVPQTGPVLRARARSAAPRPSTDPFPCAARPARHLPALQHPVTARSSLKSSRARSRRGSTAVVDQDVQDGRGRRRCARRRAVPRSRDGILRLRISTQTEELSGAGLWSISGMPASNRRLRGVSPEITPYTTPPNGGASLSTSRYRPSWLSSSLCPPAIAAGRPLASTRPHDRCLTRSTRVPSGPQVYWTASVSARMKWMPRPLVAAAGGAQMGVASMPSPPSTTSTATSSS